jgi:hypothetical protein
LAQADEAPLRRYNKTDDVIDTDARLKTMVAFRDRLRGLLATPGARLKEIVARSYGDSASGARSASGPAWSTSGRGTPAAARSSHRRRSISIVEPPMQTGCRGSPS